MWTSLLINAILSIIIIFILHHLWEYCKHNYTSQKTKNLAEIQASKYKQIAEDMERNLEYSQIDDQLESREITPAQRLLNVVTANNSGSGASEEQSVQEFTEDVYTAHRRSTQFLPLDEKEWVHTELTTFIETL